MEQIRINLCIIHKVVAVLHKILIQKEEDKELRARKVDKEELGKRIQIHRIIEFRILSMKGKAS